MMTPEDITEADLIKLAEIAGKEVVKVERMVKDAIVVKGPNFDRKFSDGQVVLWQPHVNVEQAFEVVSALNTRNKKEGELSNGINLRDCGPVNWLAEYTINDGNPDPQKESTYTTTEALCRSLPQAICQAILKQDIDKYA